MSRDEKGRYRGKLSRGVSPGREGRLGLEEERRSLEREGRERAVEKRKRELAGGVLKMRKEMGLKKIAIAQGTVLIKNAEGLTKRVLQTVENDFFELETLKRGSGFEGPDNPSRSVYSNTHEAQKKLRASWLNLVKTYEEQFYILTRNAFSADEIFETLKKRCPKIFDISIGRV